MNATISKRTLVSPAGFGDWSPAEAIQLNKMLGIIKAEYELAGYTPLHTPLVERPEVLFAKAEGEIKQQVYGLRLMNPAPASPTDEKDLALRFDHTVPLARYVAANHGELLFPFRRHVIGSVLRGERPKEGRYREFIQADVDVIGSEKLSLDHDAEMIAIISNVFERLDFGRFTIRVNNRKILKGFLESAGCDTDEKARAARKIVDDVEKVGTDGTLARLVELGIPFDSAKQVLVLLTKSYATDEAMTLLRSHTFGDTFAEGVEELATVLDVVRMLGVPEDRYCVDLSVARGLDYYTSTVYEAKLDEHPALGSIAGGGRYDSLADNFSSKHLPGVGVSIGVTRLLRRLIKFGVVKLTSKSVASVLILCSANSAEKHLQFARSRILREAGIPTETYLEQRSDGAQRAFAHKRGIKLTVSNGQSGALEIRRMDTGATQTCRESELLQVVQSML